MEDEFSYGIIPLRKVGSDWEVLMVRHVSGHWSFPKGHSEEGETHMQTAERELDEETTLKVSKVLTDKTLTENYKYNFKGSPRNKIVTYFIAEVEGEVTIPPRELIDSTWVSIENASDRATFREAKKICKNLKKILPSL